jgi:hypothetical protein
MALREKICVLTIGSLGLNNTPLSSDQYGLRSRRFSVERPRFQGVVPLSLPPTFSQIMNDITYQKWRRKQRFKMT